MNKTLHYNGYTGSVEWSAEDGLYYGRVEGITDGVTYEGQDLPKLEEDFKGAVDCYLNSCRERGVTPCHPYSGSITLRVTPEEHSRLASLARRAGVSLSAYLRQVLAAL